MVYSVVVLTRRSLLRALLASFAAALAAAWASLSRARRSQGPGRVTLAAPTSDGVTFERDVLLVRQGAELRAFSARCPHLGCRLSRVEAGALVCPCHGSRFDLDGHRLAGPAPTDLRPLAIAPRAEDGRIDVVLPS
jgi:cytochrome b6-f complex iron-sulfur subunit